MNGYRARNDRGRAGSGTVDSASKDLWLGSEGWNAGAGRKEKETRSTCIQRQTKGCGQLTVHDAQRLESHKQSQKEKLQALVEAVVDNKARCASVLLTKLKTKETNLLTHSFFELVKRHDY